MATTNETHNPYESSHQGEGPIANVSSLGDTGLVPSAPRYTKNNDLQLIASPDGVASCPIENKKLSFSLTTIVRSLPIGIRAHVKSYVVLPDLRLRCKLISYRNSKYRVISPYGVSYIAMTSLLFDYLVIHASSCSSELVDLNHFLQESDAPLFLTDNRCHDNSSHQDFSLVLRFKNGEYYIAKSITPRWEYHSWPEDIISGSITNTGDLYCSGAQIGYFVEVRNPDLIMRFSLSTDKFWIACALGLLFMHTSCALFYGLSDVNESVQSTSGTNDDDDLHSVLDTISKNYCDECLNVMNRTIVDSPIERDLRNSKCKHITRSSEDSSDYLEDIMNMVKQKIKHPWVERHVKPLVLFLLTIQGCSNNTSRIAAFLAYLDKSIYGLIADATDIFDEIFCTQATSSFKTTAARTLKGLRKRLESITDLTAEGIYPLFMKFVTLIACLPIIRELGIIRSFSSFGLINIKLKEIPRLDNLVVDACVAGIQVLEYIIGVESEDVMSYKDFCFTVTYLVQNEQNRYTGEIPVIGSVSNIDYRSMLSKAILFQSKILSKFEQLSSLDRRDYTSLFSMLNGVVARNNRENSNQHRDKPFVIGITGVTGTGKTEIAEQSALEAAKKLGFLDVTKDQIYWKNKSKWWDGYQPGLHLIVIIDELPSAKAEYGGNANSELFTNLLNVLSQTAYLTEQAEAHNKSSFYLQAPVFVVMSNTRDFEAGLYLSCPQAFARRFNIKIHIHSVKPEFRMKSLPTINPKLVPEGTINVATLHYDRWFESSNKFSPVCDKKTSVPIDLEISQFYDIVGKLAVTHKRDVAETHRRTGKTIAGRCIHDVFHCNICTGASIILPVEISDVLTELVGNETSLEVVKTEKVAYHDFVPEDDEEENLWGDRVEATSWMYIPPIGLACSVIALVSSRSKTTGIIEEQNRDIAKYYSRMPIWTQEIIVFVSTSIMMLSWFCIYGISRSLAKMLRFNALTFAVNYAEGQIVNCSLWFEQRLSAPESVEAILRRFEDRSIAKVVNIQKYRGLLRFLGILISIYPVAHLAKNAYNAVIPSPVSKKNKVALKIKREMTRVRCSKRSTDIKQEISNVNSTALNMDNIGQPVKYLPITKSVWQVKEDYYRMGDSCCNPVASKLIGNTYLVTCGTQRTFFFGLSNQFFVYANHTKIAGLELDMYQSVNTSEGFEWIKIFNGIITDDFISKVNLEVNLVYIPGVRPNKNITGWLFKKMDSLPPCTFKGLAYDFEKAAPVVDEGEGHVGVYVLPVQGARTAFKFHGTRESYRGRCGTPLIVNLGKQQVLYGINVAGDVGKSLNVYYPILLPEYETAVENIRKRVRCVMPTSGTSIEESRVERGLKPLRDISRLGYMHFQEPGGTAVVLGEDPERRGASLNSSVVLSPWTDEVFDLFPAMRHELRVPIFKHTRYNGEYVSSEGNGLKQLKNIPQGYHLGILENIVDHLKEKFLPLVPAGSLHVLTFETACRGTSSLAHFNPLKKKTAIGEPHKGKKGDYMIPAPAPDAPDGFIMNSVIKKDCDYSVSCYLQDRVSNATWRLSDKDEPLKREKVEKRETRLFSVGECHQLILAKCIFGRFVDAVMSQPFEFETICGVNCFSMAWEQFYNRMKGGKVINSDFKRYDKSIPAIIIQYVFTLIFSLIRVWYHDWTSELEDVGRGVATESMFPIYIVSGLYVQYSVSNPSGCFLTLLVNGFAQMIMVRYSYVIIYHEIPLRECLRDYDKQTKECTLGDDGTRTVIDRPRYNYISLSEELALHGMIMTPADKTATGGEYEPEGSNTIGKRSFLHCEGLVLCPLELPAIGKMITTCMDNTVVPVQEKMTLSFEAAGSEFAMFGRSFFNENFPKLLALALKYDIASQRMKALTYDGIIEKFRGGVLTPHICEKDVE